jgi:hypothetical protein
MGAVAKIDTPGMDALFKRLRSRIENDELDYPNDSNLIAADHPEFGAIVSESLLLGQPMVVFFPDGSEYVVPAVTARQPRS